MFRLRCSFRPCLLAIPFSLATVQGLLAQSSKEPSSKPDSAPVTEVAEDITVSDPAAAAKLQSRVVAGIRQLTFEGKRAGEAYFGKDGRMLVFQSEREPENPFFQIYVMDRETGDTHRVSPGHGKTTCAWLHPSGKQVVYASTELDPDALQKQKAEIDFRASGQTKRYSWDYDPTYDLIVRDISGENPVRLTDAVGYDAEGSYSPDGSLICFASNRRAYSGELNEEEKKLFEVDPSSAMDLYIMKADGTDVRRLTDTIGYDGGPFFSPDGKKICFRRFAKNGAVAEIMTMNIDGSDQRTLTHLEKVSWAPFYHPSGEYLVFATNRHGFDNFEVYMVDAEGKHEPVRVTYRKGFDGLPVFSPDGKTLIWTSNNNSSQSQLFQAKWDHAAARELISANPPAATPKVGRAEEEHSDNPASKAEAEKALADSTTGITAADIGRHVDYLCRPELGGRLTGTEGEKKATAYVAAYLESLGLKPAGENGTFFQDFEFTADVKLGSANQLASGDQSWKVDTDWRPLFFSAEGSIDPADVVFAGYGITAPAGTDQDAYDSYKDLDVRGKWVLVFRFLPENITPERRQFLSPYSVPRYKAMTARDHGAKGLIIVSGPNSSVRQQLVPLAMDGTLGTTSLAVISVTDKVAQSWFRSSGKDLKSLQTELDKGDSIAGFSLPDVKLNANIDIDPVISRGRNVLALMPCDRPNPLGPSELVVIGAHIDHLGTGKGGSSLAKEDEIGGIHRGADDNASGVAGMLETAQYLTDEKRQGRLKATRDVLFAAWSGEELGLRGSQAFCDQFKKLYPERGQFLDFVAAHMSALEKAAPKAESKGDDKNPAPEKKNDKSDDSTSKKPVPPADPHAGLLKPEEESLHPVIGACLNMDMIGRMREQLVLQGIGSSPYWAKTIERRNVVTGLALVLQNDCNLPTDASSFFRRGVPILSAFTGSHSEYHTPRDVPETLNYEGAADTAKLMSLIARDCIQEKEDIPYIEQQIEQTRVAGLRAYLGTVPNYTREVKGAPLDGVSKGSPAEQAGLKGGDVIVELAGRKIENVYDYTYAIDALKVGQPVKVIIDRAGKRVELEITPRSRQ